MITENELNLIDLAAAGDKKAMEILLDAVQNLIFNLSLRMLGTIQDAEDAAQEINIKIIKGLPGFRKESAFTTWVYRICVNTLKNYKKSMFSKHPLSFEYYSEDIKNGFVEINPELIKNVDENLLTEELKASCTNVMLQCMDSDSRLIYVFGTMFGLDSKVAGDILGISPEAYRKRLSRIKKKMADFMKEYCGLMNGRCNCSKRIGYAIETHRLAPERLEYSCLKQLETSEVNAFTKKMEQLDDISGIFFAMPKYKNPKAAKEFLSDLIDKISL